MKIAIDVMGGDRAPDVVLEGIELFINYCSDKKNVDVRVVLVGDQSIIESLVPRYISDSNLSCIEYKHTSETVKDISPSDILKGRGADSSMVVGMKSLSSNDSGFDAFVSAGNSGVFMVSAMKYVGLLDGLSRAPAVITVPRMDGGLFYLVDAGVNVDCKPIHLFHFAQLGSVFAKNFLVNKNFPKVVLASNGEEDSKGNKLILEVGVFLKSFKGINFCGNLDCMKIFTHDFDVVVCDGFVGNIILKVVEASFSMFLSSMKKIGQGFSYPASSWMSIYGLEDVSAAALLLGIKKNCILVHGSADKLAIQSALIFSLNIVEKECLSSVRGISFI